MTGYEMSKADFLEEAMRILDAAKERRITVRLIGALAMRVHCPGSVRLHEEVLNRTLSDIDLMTYRRHTREVRRLLQDLNYVWDDRSIYDTHRF